jgi:hypothetical protein
MAFTGDERLANSSIVKAKDAGVATNLVQEGLELH